MLPPIQIAPTHMQRYQLGLVWLRRDLRLYDHAALAQALEHCQAVVLAFVFDRSILDSLPQRDRRVEFICASLQTLSDELRQTVAPRRARGSFCSLVEASASPGSICRVGR